MLDRPHPFKLHQSYRPLPRYIQEINPAAVNDGEIYTAGKK